MAQTDKLTTDLRLRLGPFGELSFYGEVLRIDVSACRVRRFEEATVP